MTYTENSDFFDYESTEIQELIAEFKGLTPKEQAIGLYNKVRDGWRYNPYNIHLNPNEYKASVIYNRPQGHCIDKSILLIAGLRALKIPAKLHLAKVKNHIGVEILTEKFGTNELTPHGMVDIYLNGQWLKVSPAFNIELCHKYKLDALDFDGETDSIFHEFNQEGNLFMEYLEDYGSFDDVPTTFIMDNLKSHYPGLFDESDEISRLVIK